MRPDDYIAIQQLLARYNHTFDSGDDAGWADCFTEDGKFQGRAGVFIGRQALRDYARAAVSRGTYRHLTGNLLIEPDLDPNRATVFSHMIYYTVTQPAGLKIELAA